jgi:hypothetical protein
MRAVYNSKALSSVPGVILLIGRCFFTNAYMGLKAGSEPTRKFPGARDAGFVRRCQRFLLERIRVQQLGLVLTLGKEVPPVLAPVAPALRREWSGARNLQELDQRAATLVYPVWFPDLLHATAVVALAHPANRSPNVARRRYQSVEGDAAELALLHDALALVGNSCLGETPA